MELNQIESFVLEFLQQLINEKTPEIKVPNRKLQTNLSRNEHGILIFKDSEIQTKSIKLSLKNQSFCMIQR